MQVVWIKLKYEFGALQTKRPDVKQWKKVLCIK